LMLAVLEDGIRCYQEHLHSPRVRARLLARQSERWIRSEDWEWPYSFNNICDSLSIEPETLRRKPCRTASPRAPAALVPRRTESTDSRRESRPPESARAKTGG
jgi:hypothetical protein